MNWEAIGAVGQVLGSVAVFVTLGYLAVQVRHARAEVKRSIFVGRQEAARELCMTRAHSEVFLTQWRAASDAFGFGQPSFIDEVSQRAALTPAGAEMLFWDQYAWWYFRMQQIPYIDELDAGERAAFENGVRFAYGSHPWMKLWYETNRSFLNPDAVRYVDSVLAQPG